MFYEVFSPTYAMWKATKTSLALHVYYVKYDMHYVALLIDKTTTTIYRIDISRDGKDPNVTDFETTIIPGATLEPEVDTAIVDALN